jgi:hypothetical protein
MEYVLSIFNCLHFQMGGNVEPFRIKDRLCVGQEPILEAFVGPSLGDDLADLSALLALVHELFTSFASDRKTKLTIDANYVCATLARECSCLSCCQEDTRRDTTPAFVQRAAGHLIQIFVRQFVRPGWNDQVNDLLGVFDYPDIRALGHRYGDPLSFESARRVGQELVLVVLVRPTSGDELAHLAALLVDKRFVLIGLFIHMTVDFQFDNVFLN